MLQRLRTLRAAVLALPLALTVANAQDLKLDVVGGSAPGTLSMDLSPGLYPFELCCIFAASNPGPTPLAIVDPADPRSMSIGAANIAASFVGVLGLDGHFRLGPVAVPPLPNLLDAGFFFQGVTLPGPGTIVDRISNPAAVRIGVPGTFRDRGVFMALDRAFATVLPRADGRWMVVGGGRGGLLAQVATRTTEIYDDVTDTFVAGPPMTTERSLHTMTKLQDGRWLLTGGVNNINDPQNLCEVYDPATDTFTAVAPMITPRTGHTATLLNDGRVFVAGGLAAMTVTPSAIYAIFDTTNLTEIYNPVTNTWTAGPNLRTPRAGQVAIPRPDGRVLIAGGISWDNLIIVQLPAVRNTTDIYNPVTNTISAGPSMSTAHSLIDAVPLGNDRWLVAGGITALTLTSPGTSTTVCEIYNAGTNTWTTTGSMATARGNHKTWSIGGGRFLSVGGGNGTLLAPVPLATGEIFDVATNAWTPGPSLTIPRAGAAAFLTPRGQVHVMGGGTSNGAIAISSEFYFF